LGGERVPTVRVRVNVEGIEQLADGLRRAAINVEERVRAQLLKNGERTAEVAAANASEHSKSIPPTVKALPTESGAIVSAGDGSSPLPSLMEKGSEFKPNPALWRHPLFGDREHWYGQKTHPYLLPAVVETRAENDAAIATALGDLARETIGPELPA
jgi:hypothetical protein